MLIRCAPSFSLLQDVKFRGAKMCLLNANLNSPRLFGFEIEVRIYPTSLSFDFSKTVAGFVLLFFVIFFGVLYKQLGFQIIM
jgi:hypothetical protein